MKKRILLAEGYPWFLGADYSCVAIAKTSSATCVDSQPLKFKNLGAWQFGKLIFEYETRRKGLFGPLKGLSAMEKPRKNKKRKL